MDIGIDGFRAGAIGFGFGAVVVAEGSGVAHASLEPQASLLFERLENALVDAGCAGGLGVVCDGAAGAERLKAELMFEDGAGAGVGAGGFVGAALGGVDSEKSKRSFEALVATGFVDAGAGDAKLKSPKSFEARGAKLA